MVLIPILGVVWIFFLFPTVCLFLWGRGYSLRRVYWTKSYIWMGIAYRGERVGKSTLDVEKNVLICPIPCLTLEWYKNYEDCKHRY